jgi:WD40 repeat protein
MKSNLFFEFKFYFLISIVGMLLPVNDLKSQEYAVLKGTKEPIACLSFSPDSRSLASGNLENAVLWEVLTAKERAKFKSIEGWNQCIQLSFSPDGRKIALAKNDSVEIWFLPKNLHQMTLRDRNEDILHTTFSPDGKLIASCGKGKNLCLWETETGQLSAILPHNEPKVGPSVFSENGVLLVTGNRGIRIWNIPNQKIEKVWKNTDFTPNILLFLNHNTLLLADSVERLVKWNFEKEPPPKISDLGCFPTTIAISACGTLRAKISNMNTVTIENLLSGKEIAHFKTAGKRIQTLAISPDKTFVAAGTGYVDDQHATEVILWKLPEEELFSKQNKREAKKLEFSFPSEKVNENEKLEIIWSKLGDFDAKIAYQGIWEMAEHDEKVVNFLRGKLIPVPDISQEKIEKLVLDLNSDVFSTRQNAMEKLKNLAELAEFQLRKASKSKSDPEFKIRVNSLLNSSPQRGKWD